MSAGEWFWLGSWAIWCWHYVRTKKQIEAMRSDGPTEAERTAYRIVTRLRDKLLETERFAGAKGRWETSQHAMVGGVRVKIIMRRRDDAPSSSEAVGP